MAINPLHQLEQCGQSVWTDVISRQMLRSGALARSIRDDGITGVTANPTIFEKAIAGTHDYDDTIRAYAAKGYTASDIYEALAIEDVGAAADLLRSVYERTEGKDGFISIEVSPELAHDTDASIDEARRFWSKLSRPNVMIKIPATQEGLSAIEQLTADGINVNITLIFGIGVYRQVMEAYLLGLGRRFAENQSIDRIASVASFFVSRVDTLVDALLDEKSEDVDESTRADLHELRGKAAVANAKLAYEWFERVFGSEQFTRLEVRGARVQRPLWASTSTKNPAYSDTLYVAPLIGPQTVNTMTLETIDAFRDHGAVDCNAIREDREEATSVFESLGQAGISMSEVAERLTEEGVEKFTASLHGLLDAIEQRRGGLIHA